MLMGNPFRLLAALAWTCDASTLLVPAYWWAATDSSGVCTTADFHALAAAGDAAVAVVNPNNGPIDSSDANFAAFAACVAAFVDARAIGYVYTKIAEETSPGVWEQRAFRDAGDVEADLDAWKKSKYDCDYVAKKSKRCKSKYTDFDDVSSLDACPVACGECEPTCEDSTSWYWKKSKYDCDYVAKKSKRCKSNTSWYSKKSKNDCAWVEKKIVKRCKSEVRDDDDVHAKEACPVACQEC
ncbi:hypothetical protein JL722_13445 [Aureococcus anophagefferens]|nr:hypothetical protein JL722_13445 [Aureococcus anophagefferens]